MQAMALAVLEYPEQLSCTVRVLWNIVVTGSVKNAIIWDQELSVMVISLQTESSSTDPVLNGMRKKGEKVSLVTTSTSTVGTGVYKTLIGFVSLI